MARIAAGAALAGLVFGVWVAVSSDAQRQGMGRIFGAAPAYAFDGTTTPSTAALAPGEGLRASAHPPETAPGKTSALTALQYAAEQGQPVASGAEIVPEPKRSPG